MGRFINADGYAATGQGLLGNNMFAYCNNNPVNRSDPSGEISTLAIVKGLIGAVSSVSCALLDGQRGMELVDDAVLGFLSGCCDWFGSIYSIYEAITTGIEYAKESDNVLLGITAGLLSYGVSLFTGENISKIPGVNELDDAAEVFFDAVFGYGANVFNELAWNDIASYYEEPNAENK